MDKQFEFLIYQSTEEDVSVNALIKDETIRVDFVKIENGNVTHFLR